MKILVVCRWHGKFAAAFIADQKQSLEDIGHDVRYCCATRGGFKGYIELLRNVRKVLRGKDGWIPNIIHAHYGMCGLVACLATRLSLHAHHSVPVVTTYPGSDINNPKMLPFSKLCIRMSAYNLFMSQRQIHLVVDVAKPEKTAIQRYGIKLDDYQVIDSMIAREAMNLPLDKKLVLFCSKYIRLEKDPDLAKAVMKLVPEAELLELTGGYTKQELVMMMNAVDVGLITSKTEGSPQFTKEMMSCGTPVVSVDVGDVIEQFSTKTHEILDGYYVAKTREPAEIASLVKQAIYYGKTKGPEQVKYLEMDVKQVARNLEKIYSTILNK